MTNKRKTVEELKVIADNLRGVADELSPEHMSDIAQRLALEMRDGPQSTQLSRWDFYVEKEGLFEGYGHIRFCKGEWIVFDRTVEPEDARRLIKSLQRFVKRCEAEETK